MISDHQNKELIEKAIQVRNNAYSPYSNYKVGAALLSKSGKIYTGANYENASFGAGVCAERIALGNALSNGERDFLAICICGNDANITPCGICRQSLSEFSDIEVICCNSKGDSRFYKLTELLPNAFSFVSRKK